MKLNDFQAKFNYSCLDDFQAKKSNQSHFHMKSGILQNPFHECLKFWVIFQVLFVRYAIGQTPL